MKKTVFARQFVPFADCPCGSRGRHDGSAEGPAVNPHRRRHAGSGTVASGLKEALSVGTKNAVGLLSKKDGYFGNEAVKILLPENIRRVGDALRMAGYQKEVDAFVLSMNRAAEKAAPKAADIFAGAIQSMSIDDAQKILGGGNTAATEYFKSKTSTQLFDAFKPDISKSMNEVGVTKAYKAMTDRYTTMMPFAKMDSLDLDKYVTDKSLDGLFHHGGAGGDEDPHEPRRPDDGSPEKGLHEITKTVRFVLLVQRRK